MRHFSKGIAVALFMLSTFILAGDRVDGVDRVLSDPQRFEMDKARDLTSKPAEVLKFFGLKPGMKVADIFGGGGYYSEIMAGGVGPEGKVYLHNNQAYWAYIGKEVEKRTANNRLPLVTQLRTETTDLQLPKGELDMVIIVLGYHDLYYAGQGWPKIDATNFMAQIKGALKPGGILGIVDHCAEPGSGSQHAQQLHRIDKDFARKDIESHGFEFLAETDILRNPDDDHQKLVMDPSIRRKTDRFVYRFKKK